MKTGLYIFLAAALLAVGVELRAHDKEIVNTPSLSTNTTSIVNINNTKGVALAISMAQIDFSHSTQKYQGGFGIGFYNDVTGISGGVAKRFKDTLIKVTVGLEEDRLGMGIGIMWQFN